MSFRTASVYVWVVVLLAGVELALQYRAHRRGWDAPLFRTASASVASVAEEKPLRYGPTSDFPFRSEIVSRECPSGTSRLWVASASHAEDIYLSVEETFPAQTARLLARAGEADWQALNASRAGNVIATNTADLSRLGAEWQPRVVVLYQMSMDVVDLSREYLAANKPGKPPRKDDQPTETTGESSLRKAAAETTIYTALKANVTPWIAGQRVLANDLGEDAERDFDRRIRDFLRIVRHAGAIPVLTTFATSHGPDAERLPLDVRQFMLRYNKYLSPAGWTRTIARFNGVIRRIASEEDVLLVDCESAMTGEARYFRDYVHFTPAGHQKVAELLSEKVFGLSAGSRLAVSNGRDLGSNAPDASGRPHPSPLPEGEGTRHRPHSSSISEGEGTER